MDFANTIGYYTYMVDIIVMSLFYKKFTVIISEYITKGG